MARRSRPVRRPATRKRTVASRDPAAAAWRALAAHARQIRKTPLRDLFAADPERFARFSLSLDGLLLDLSKNPITERTVALLVALAEAADVAGWRRKMFAGQAINRTERRAAFHIALRAKDGTRMRAAGVDVAPEIMAVRAQMRAFVDAVHGGTWRGAAGAPLADVVNIGIGGSDLGPRMACDALGPYARPGMGVHFVANVDGNDIARTLAELDPKRTLFVVTSKTFTTQETMRNARTARAWLTAALGEAAVAKHFVAVSTNEKAVAAFGIAPVNMFRFWDWVGGRFSLWSSVGLSIALLVGMGRFEELLAGGAAMDHHFRTAPLKRNLPAMLALVGAWNATALGCRAHAVLPYDQRLERFPAFLQQLEMESNGKGVTRDGRPVPRPTCPIVFGEPGTNGQHAFFQLLHQGTTPVSTDFIVAARPGYDLPGQDLAEHHAMLLANCLAQTEALMRGRTSAAARAELAAAGLDKTEIERLAPHKTFPGNRPSTTIVLERLDPYRLGLLIALYEHKTFVQGVLWGVNSFDQWGVELGKKLADALLFEIAGKKIDDADHDSSTRGLLERIRAWREGER